MGLSSIIRSNVKTIDSLTKDLQAQVLHYAWIGFDTTYAGPSYIPTPVKRMGIVDYKQKLRRTGDGQEIMQKASVIFVGAIEANGATDRQEPIDSRDKIVLPNGYTGPILSVEGVVDPSTNMPYAIEVILG